MAATDDPVSATRAALERDPQINLHRFPLEIDWDDERAALRIRGTIADITALRRSLQVAHRFARQVVDDLHITTTGGREDAELAEAVVRILSDEPAFHVVSIADADQGAPPGPGDDRAWITVSVSGSRVRLEGHLHSSSHRRLAEVTTWWVAGVSRVENAIEVAYDDDSDEELTDVVRMVLDKDPTLDDGRLRAGVTDRRVVLQGSVPTDTQRRIAVWDCWYVPGVEDVDDRLLEVVEGPR